MGSALAEVVLSQYRNRLETDDVARVLDSVASARSPNTDPPPRRLGSDKRQGGSELSDPHRWLTLAESVHHRLAHHRRGVALLVYASLILAATALASAFSVGLDLRAVGWTDTVLIGCLLVLVRLPLYWRLRLSIGRWRFVGVGEVIRLAGATVLGSIMVGALAPSRSRGSRRRRRSCFSRSSSQ